jgi:hypothetical protein
MIDMIILSLDIFRDQFQSKVKFNVRYFKRMLL